MQSGEKLCLYSPLASSFVTVALVKDAAARAAFVRSEIAALKVRSCEGVIAGMGFFLLILAVATTRLHISRWLFLGETKRKAHPACWHHKSLKDWTVTQQAQAQPFRMSVDFKARYVLAYTIP